MTADDFTAPRPRYGPVPEARVDGNHVLYADAIVAEVPGFRPLTLDLVRPAKASGTVPLVIWIHGGAWLEGTNKRFIPHFSEIPSRIVRSGYAVTFITYRLSGEAHFPAQLHDVKAAVRWLRHHAAELAIDASRFAVWGESAGGHLAALLALTGDDPELAGDVGSIDTSDRVHAGVIWYGPTNLLSMQSQALPDAVLDHDAPDSPESCLLGAPPQHDATRAAFASPVSYALPNAAPVRLVHGTADRIVPWQQSQELYQHLRSAGSEAELHLVPGADHCFIGVPAEPLIDDALDFLGRVLDNR
ncbi:alpha/beta hydrolase [Streptomyces zagrosensis]|uniref:Acetyl esterase/lipase n=1 Tax=Streptomyces zagrosensis TaxID=1042984 RepID=A0A7W9V1T2_9ACTN|nr:alpha/beta hydrolase [Streptomyces zagrosensis]MBB5938581.1 acetyl esterase/lipase [Streptomyces zagrosensis]